jgi:hypothetical protein
MNNEMKRRLLALEAAAAPATASGELTEEELRRLSATIDALFKGLAAQAQPANLTALLERLDAGTESEADRLTLANLPPCHMAPHELVRFMAEVVASF